MTAGRDSRIRSMAGSDTPGAASVLRVLTRPLRWLRRQLSLRLSIRLKLTIYYGLMCLITLALAGGVMYWTVDRQLSSQVDSGLLSAAGRLQRSLRTMRVPPFTPTVARELTGQCRYWYQTDGRYFDKSEFSFCVAAQRVINAQAVTASQPGIVGGLAFGLTFHIPGSPLARVGPPVLLCPSFGGTNRSLSSGLVASPPSSCGVFSSDSTPLAIARVETGLTASLHAVSFNHTTVRLYHGLLHLPHGMPGTAAILGPVLFAYQNESPYDAAIHTVFLTLVFGIPLGVIIALGAGFWIARAALRPIGRISRTVRSIGESKDLSRRIDFVGPYDEVGRLAATFDSMMERIEAVFETQRRFVADASHELRTPLTAIRGNADLMRIAPPDEREECLTTIRKEAVRMTRLVNDLLLLAEAEAGQGQIHLVPTALDDVLLDVYGSARALAEGKVELILESADQVTVNGDSDRLKQLLLNLIDNAVKFTPDGGTVSVGLVREGDTARMTVSDSGIGIAPEEQDAIFRRFYRVEAARTRRGSGLGLSIVSWIIQEHGGRLELSSAPEKGTTFTVILPALESRRAADHAVVA